MDLKSGTFYWPSVDPAAPRFGVLEMDTQAEVVVIGTGVSGAMVADRLSGEGLDVLMIDRRAVCTGSTPASTGLLQYEIDTSLTELVDLVGRDHANRAYAVSYASLGKFRELVGGLDDDCALNDRQSLYLSRASDDFQTLAVEHDARRKIGIEVELLDAHELKRRFNVDRRGGALWSARAMEVDPLRLTLALLRRAVLRGVRIHAHTEVSSYDPTDTGVTLTTATGRRIRASRVVFATGYETPQFLDPDICELHSTYALTSRPLTDDQLAAWQDRCLIWEMGNPYFYARTTRDNRVMIGGEDDEFSDPVARDSRIEKKCVTLVSKFGRLFPSIEIFPEFRWAGTFATTKDGLPFVGPHAKFPRGHFALGYGGNGITFSFIATQIIADQIAGRPNPDAELFRFDR